MLQRGDDLKMPAEMLLVLTIILREGERLDHLSGLSERVYDWLAIGPAEREIIAAELQLYDARISSAASILALRALAKAERRTVARQVLDFAAADPLLASHQRRLRVRVLDILALDEPI